MLTFTLVSLGALAVAIALAFVFNFVCAVLQTSPGTRRFLTTWPIWIWVGATIALAFITQSR